MTASLSVAEDPAENPPSKVCGREKVEFGVDFIHAGGNIDVDGESVLEVAPPFERLSVGLEEKSGKIDDGAVGSVLARNPLRVVQREVAGSGWDFQRGVEDFARSVRGVDGNGDRGCAGAPGNS